MVKVRHNNQLCSANTNNKRKKRDVGAPMAGSLEVRAEGMAAARLRRTADESSELMAQDTLVTVVNDSATQQAIADVRTDSLQIRCNEFPMICSKDAWTILLSNIVPPERVRFYANHCEIDFKRLLET